MALPPTIPTSFVPHPTNQTRRGFRIDFVGAFGFLALIVFIFMLALSAGVFLYEGALHVKKDSLDKELRDERDQIDRPMAQSFVRLSNRLTSGQALLNSHIAFTGFFRKLGLILPTTVRFSALHLAAADGKKVTLEGSGVAKNFNALAAASANFAADGNIRDAIFSRVVVNKDNSVSFALTATIEADLVDFKAGSVAAAAPTAAATTTQSAASTTQP